MIIAFSLVAALATDNVLKFGPIALGQTATTVTHLLGPNSGFLVRDRVTGDQRYLVYASGGRELLLSFSGAKLNSITVTPRRKLADTKYARSPIAKLLPTACSLDSWRWLGTAALATPPARIIGLRRKVDQSPGQAPDAIEFTKSDEGFGAIFSLDQAGRVSQFQMARE